MRAPSLPLWLLDRFGVDEAVVGDVVEQRAAGRSIVWFWRQTVAAVALTAASDVRAHPWRSVRAVIAGWTVLLLLFGLLGDRAADSLAHVVWGWTRAAGYGSHVWWPFQIAAVVVSYAGFGLSAWVVTRQDRGQAAAALLSYVASVLLVLFASAAVLAWIAPRAVAVPHPLFYVISVALPYHWRAGFVLVPFVTVICGLLGTASRRTRTAG